jgi:hypothetical protein
MTWAYPRLALAVRQPWAWAIIYAGKDIENRTPAAIDKGNMRPGRVAILASKGMTQDEYREGAAFMASIGVTCPNPAALVRGGLIGEVDVVSIVRQHASRWFQGPRGLVLANPRAYAAPVPASGQLGFFQWTAGGEIEPSAKWMRETLKTPDLFA